MADHLAGGSSRWRRTLGAAFGGARRPLWLSFGGGALIGLGQVPFSLLPFALAGLALVLASTGAAPGPGRAFLRGWLAGTGYFAVSLHWIVEPFLVDVARHGWMAPFALLFSAVGFALFWGLAAWGAARLVPRPGTARVIALAALWAAAEWLRSTVLTGFSWGLVGYIWTESPAAQIAAWTGSYGLTLVTILLGVPIALAARRGALGGAAVLAVAWLLPIALGWLITPPPQAAGPDAPLLRLVQPNAPQAEKWDPAKIDLFFTRQLEYTAAPGAPDLTIWPETAIPWLLEENHPALRRIAAAAQGRPVIIGANRVEGARAYNALAVIGPEGRIDALYDKHHLVPFGEYMPLGGLTRLVGLRSFAARDGYGFSPGPGPGQLDLAALPPGGAVRDLGRAVPLICYEAIFPRNVLGAPGRADWMVQITNDAWFGTFSGPYQHLAQARMRAIETGLPMVRVANTGISAVIDAAGRVLGMIELNAAGYLDQRLPPPLPPTLYARSGDWPALGAMLLLALGAARAGRRGRAWLRRRQRGRHAETD
ncbi:apolipoprotein N-acyltransferase [Profundibacterium mesophilum]|uniref:Apolipoprotein N-acyltransferase n=1 Tax=Profundibacterium mesophilum KAUST100406-0324 TaxID=1037889 RepID=A0A921TF98_9RHOB|nr:apolipoprotein N-acyltransferase [Profundibacterium mesophilum]KAF0676244.1 Apolipoprotein N-acyltransferase [Profundibacterium mesophilum KAUST100406-0324]